MIHRVHSKYSHDFNGLYGRVGHLFQGRYRAFLVLDDQYLENLLVYIHGNPRRARLLENEDLYPWSSERYYMTGRTRLESFEPVPGYGGPEGMRSYRALLQSREVTQPPIYKTFIGKKEEVERVDRRKQGRGGGFRRERRSLPGLIEIAERCSFRSGIPVKNLCGPGRKRVISRARVQAIREMLSEGYGPTEISRFLNRTPGAVLHAVESL